MAHQTIDDPIRPLTFVACVSNEEILRANLLTSPCLHPGSAHELLLIKNCQSAADGLNAGISRARNDLVVCLHQDVRLPPGWDRKLAMQLDAAARQWGPIGVAGVYGVGEPTPLATPTENVRSRALQTKAPPKFAVQRMGRVIHRGHPLFDGRNIPSRASTLDELLLVLPRDTPLRFDAALGFHLYGADICLQAHELGLAVAVIDAVCHHNSRTTSLPRAFFHSAGVFARKWKRRLPVATSCVVIDQSARVWVLGGADRKRAPLTINRSTM